MQTMKQLFEDPASVLGDLNLKVISLADFFYRVTGKFSTPREYAVLVGVEGQSHGTGLTTPCTIQTPAEHCVGGNFLRTAQVQCTSDSPFCSCNSKNSFIARTSQLSGKDTIV